MTTPQVAVQPPGLVERPRLLRLVDGGVRGPLTLVSAPAGSGKTVLLTSWMATQTARGRAARLTLGPEHADPRQFWTDVIAAAGRACGELAGVAVPPDGPLESFVIAARASLSDLAEPLVLVLDDLHEVGAASGAIAELGWLLDHAPDPLRLIVATRSDPPLRLQRLRIAGRMTELRAADLAFTLSEAAQLVAAHGLTPDDVELLGSARRDGRRGSGSPSCPCRTTRTLTPSSSASRAMNARSASTSCPR